MLDIVKSNAREITHDFKIIYSACLYVFECLFTENGYKKLFPQPHGYNLGEVCFLFMCMERFFSLRNETLQMPHLNFLVLGALQLMK